MSTWFSRIVSPSGLKSIFLPGLLAMLLAAAPIATAQAAPSPRPAVSPAPPIQASDPSAFPRPPAVAALPAYGETRTADGLQVCGEISSDAVWTTATGVYTVTCDVHVMAGVTLTIQPGVAVRFQHAADDLIVSGALQAVGMEAAPILFEPASGAAPGSWGRVAFLAGSAGVLDHARLTYGGHEDGMLYLASEQVQVLHSLVQSSADTGIVIQTPARQGSQAPLKTSPGEPARAPSRDPGELRMTFLPAILADRGSVFPPAGPVIRNTDFVSNTGVYGGGLYNEAGNPIIQGNTFAGNTVDGVPWAHPGLGGGLYNGSGSPDIRNNTFVGNGGHGLYGFGGGLYNESGRPIISNNTFRGNVAGYRTSGGGLYNASGSPIIGNNTFADNYAEQDGGGLLNDSGSPIIRNNRFTDNVASGRIASGHGGGLSNRTGRPLIEGNVFAGNSIGAIYGPGYGGGVYDAGSNTIIQNNVFRDNVARGPGGGLYVAGNATIRNNTFRGNGVDSTAFAGGGLASSGGAPVILNNILVNNSAPQGGGLSIEAGSPIVDYNDLWNNTGGDCADVAAGPHDLAADPLFVDAAAGDFHLAAGSPLIDAGDPAHYPPTDFDDDPRPLGAAPDIGADEFQVDVWATCLDDEHGLAFEYPTRYDQEPMASRGCTIRAEVLEDGRPIVVFGSDNHLIITPARGISLGAYAERFMQQFDPSQYPRRDDERLRNHNPRGIVVEAVVMHHPTIHVLYQGGDTIFELHARPSLACSDPSQGIVNPDMFWRAVDSFHFTRQWECKRRGW